MSIPKILQLAEVMKHTGTSRAHIYKLISRGLWTRSVNLSWNRRGGRAGWPEHEVEALVKFVIANKSQEEIRALVVKLEAARKTAADEYEASLNSASLQTS